MGSRAKEVATDEIRREEVACGEIPREEAVTGEISCHMALHSARGGWQI
jgi:hypothetical protein